MTVWMMLVAAAAATAAAEPRKGYVQVEIVDAFGKPVEGEVHAEVYRDGDLVAEVSHRSPLKVGELRFGRYQIKTTVSGFEPEMKNLVLTRESVALRIGLRLAAIGDPQQTPLTLSGKVMPCSMPRNMWVKITGVFTNESVEVRIGSDCTFQTRELHGGRYVGVLTEGGAVRGIEEATLTVESPPMLFTLGAR